MDSFGVSDDVVTNVKSIIYASKRLDITELQDLATIFKGQMRKVEFRDAALGEGVNKLIRDTVDYVQVE